MQEAQKAAIRIEALKFAFIVHDRDDKVPVEEFVLSTAEKFADFLLKDEKTQTEAPATN